MWEHAKGGLFMNKERLEWVLSGLNRYKLTQKEDQFVKSTEYDFNQKNMITEQQGEKLESLYKEKSKFIPNRDYFSPKESIPRERPRREGIFQNRRLDEVLSLCEAVLPTGREVLPAIFHHSLIPPVIPDPKS